MIYSCSHFISDLTCACPWLPSSADFTFTLCTLEVFVVAALCCHRHAFFVIAANVTGEYIFKTV